MQATWPKLFLLGLWKVNSDSHVCKANYSTTEPLPQSKSRTFKYIYSSHEKSEVGAAAVSI